MDKALFDEKVEGAIDGGWCGGGMRAAQGVENGVGTHRLVTAPDQGQHLAAQRSKPCAALLAELRRAVERAVDAALVVVARATERTRCRQSRTRHWTSPVNISNVII